MLPLIKAIWTSEGTSHLSCYLCEKCEQNECPGLELSKLCPERVPGILSLAGWWALTFLCPECMQMAHPPTIAHTPILMEETVYVSLHTLSAPQIYSQSLCAQTCINSLAK